MINFKSFRPFSESKVGLKTVSFLTNDQDEPVVHIIKDPDDEHVVDADGKRIFRPRLHATVQYLSKMK